MRPIVQIDATGAPAASPRGERHEFRVLLVEDSPEDAELAAYQIRRAVGAVRLKRVDNESAFRAALADFSPEVVLSDFSLPGFNGLRAMDIALTALPGIPFILLSGTLREDDAIEAMKRGATDFVSKDNLGRLGPALRRVLKEQDSVRAQHAAEAGLKQSEQRLADLINTCQDWIWELDADGRYVYSNGAIHDILGYRPVDIIGQHYLELVQEQDRAGLALRWSTMLDEREPMSGVVARFIHSDGTPRWLERNVMPVTNGQHRITAFRGSDRDITLRRSQAHRVEHLSRVYEMLSRVDSAIVRLRQRDQLLREACRIAVEHGSYETAHVYLIEPGKGALRMLATHRNGDLPDLPHEIAVDDDADTDKWGVVEAMRTEQPVVSPGHGLRNPASLALPLIVDGTPVGVFVLTALNVHVFDPEDVQLLEQLSSNVSFALQYLRKEDAVQFLAWFDPLTGLAKLPLFFERLSKSMEEARTRNQELAVLVCDIERLAIVNDSLGRHIGDKLLQLVADRLKDWSHDTQRLAHLGGGTFAVVIERSYDESEGGSCYDFRSALTLLFADAFDLDGQQIRVSVRTGIANFPTDGHSAELLVQHAESALKRAREQGERHSRYTHQISADVTRLLALESRLHRALEEEQFVLHYQPTIDIGTGEICGVEALIRWNDPSAGLRQPGEFVDVLESTGLIEEVGHWVLRQAVSDFTNWRTTGMPELRVAVNVSALQLRRREFVDTVVKVLGDIPPGSVWLDLEITESMLMHDISATTRKLERLRGIGVNIALDDFGTGYSSLSRLSSLPVDVLKVDRSFVRGMETDPGHVTLVSTVIRLARAFNLTAVAEGVETPSQLGMLRAMKCDRIQGYLIARPMPAHELEEFVLRRGGIVQLPA